MKIPIIASDYLLEIAPNLGVSYSRTEKFADELLAKLLLNNEILGSFTGVPLDIPSALFVGTTIGGLDRSENEYLLSKKTNEIIPQKFVRHEAGKMTEYLAKKYKFDKHYTISTACSSGLHAIGLAKQAIEKGLCDFAVAIGTDALCELTQKGFGSLMLLDESGSAKPTRGSHPFDKNRAGIKLGEGAGGVVLVSPKICENADFFIAGSGSSCDAHHATAPHPTGDGAISAINQAIKSAGIKPSDIDWICSHGTGTLDNDVAEIKAYRAVFGGATTASENIPPFMSFKGEIGHTLAASGAIETAMAIEAMRKGIIPASAGFSEIDEEIGIAPNTKITDCPSKYILKVSFGFGGNNAALVVENARNK